MSRTDCYPLATLQEHPEGAQTGSDATLDNVAAQIEAIKSPDHAVASTSGIQHPLGDVSAGW